MVKGKGRNREESGEKNVEINKDQLKMLNKFKIKSWSFLYKQSHRRWEELIAAILTSNKEVGKPF